MPNRKVSQAAADETSESAIVTTAKVVALTRVGIFRSNYCTCDRHYALSFETNWSIENDKGHSAKRKDGSDFER